MKHRPILALLLAAMILLAACSTAPQYASLPPETLESSAVPVPATTEPQFTTVPIETTEPTVEVTIPKGYPFSFFMYFSAPVQAYCNFYIAPAGTEDWYPVLIDQAQIWHTHPRIPNGNPDDDVVITRAYIAYDGSDISQWILRLEYPIDANGPTFNSIPKPYEYQWKTEFELENNHTLLHLELVPNYLTLPDDTEIGEYYVPTTRPMEFCENCPESWRQPVPIETILPKATTAPPEELYTEYASLFEFYPEQDNWLLNALICVYDDPREINLYYFFYSGFSNDHCTWQTVSENERQFLLDNHFGTYAEIQRLAPDAMDASLRETFGISLSDVESGIPEQWLYFEDTGCYYSNHNDTHMIFPEIFQVVELEGGLVQIHYTLDEWDSVVTKDGELIHVTEMALTLRPTENGTYQAVSNQILSTE